MKEHFDTLCDIWGGSSATVMLAEGVDGDSLTVTSNNEETNQRSEGTVIYHSRYFFTNNCC